MCGELGIFVCFFCLFCFDCFLKYFFLSDFYFFCFSPGAQLQRVQGQSVMERIICWLVDFTLNGENNYSGQYPGHTYTS